MKKLLNNLYVASPGSYVHKQGETVIIEREGERRAQIPVHALQGVYCFGQVMVSPQLMGFCAEQGVNLAFLTEHGRFLGRLQGPQKGSILLRRAQYRRTEQSPLEVARVLVAAKIRSSRNVLRRRLRAYGHSEDVEEAARALGHSLEALVRAETLDQVRGLEGEAAARYFGVFAELIAPERREEFPFDGRNRRPPRDAVNAMLSFLYSVLGQDISAALQAVGLDPQAGFLHADRPGRDSLAQDLLEEVRAWLADRLVLSLINRRQVTAAGFHTEASGAARMTDDTRKTLLAALQARKQESVIHPLLRESVSVGLIPHIQALLLARYVRGELPAYPPFVGR